MTPEATSDAAIELLRSVLGSGFELQPVTPATTDGGLADLANSADTVVNLYDTEAGAGGTLFIDVRQQLTPAAIRRDVLPRLHLLRKIPFPVAPFVVAPWLSPQTRRELENVSCNYLDLTGNVRIDIRRPRVLVTLQGAQRDPAPKASGRRGIAGPRAARVVRLLAEVAPPFRATALADAAGVTLPYVSRTLDAIADRGLIERIGRDIVHVHWRPLLEERGANTGLLRTNHAVTYIAPRGIDEVLGRLSADAGEAPVALTGTFATYGVVPTTVGGQLMLYVPGDLDAPEIVARWLRLLRSDSGDVLLLRTPDVGVFDRSRVVDGIRHVGLTQLAVDCLSGPGRMPAEGAALLDHMAEHQESWRLGTMPPPRQPDQEVRAAEWLASQRG